MPPGCTRHHGYVTLRNIRERDLTAHLLRRQLLELRDAASNVVRVCEDVRLWEPDNVVARCDAFLYVLFD